MYTEEIGREIDYIPEWVCWVFDFASNFLAKAFNVCMVFVATAGSLKRPRMAFIVFTHKVVVGKASQILSPSLFPVKW